MANTPRPDGPWVDGVTPITAANLNRIEANTADAHARIDDLVANGGGGGGSAPEPPPSLREVLHDSEPDNNAATITFTTGAGTRGGDTILVVHGADWNSDDGMLAPGGDLSTWDLVTATDAGNNIPHLKVWAASAASDGATTITINRIANFSESYFGAVIVFAGPAQVESAAPASGSSSASHTAPSLTPAGVNRLLLTAFQAGYSGSANRTYSQAPPGMTQQTLDSEGATTGGVGAMLTATEILTTTDPTGPRTATFEEARPWAAVSVLIAPADPLAALLSEVPSLEELEQSTRLGDVAAAATMALGVAQTDQRIASVALTVWDTIAADGTNYWTVSLVRYRDGSPTTIATRYTTNSPPWGTAVQSWRAWTFDLATWTEANRYLRKGDVLALDFSPSGSPAPWRGLSASWRYEPGLRA